MACWCFIIHFKPIHIHPGRILLVCSVYQHIIIYKHTVLIFYGNKSHYFSACIICFRCFTKCGLIYCYIHKNNIFLFSLNKFTYFKIKRLTVIKRTSRTNPMFMIYISLIIFSLEGKFSFLICKLCHYCHFVIWSEWELIWNTNLNIRLIDFWCFTPHSVIFQL